MRTIRNCEPARAGNSFRCLLLLGSVSLLIAAGGCGNELSIAPVSGRVTFEGEPLVGATVTTQPIAIDGVTPGSGSFGKTDEEGRFELELVKPVLKGAIIGDHRVSITPASGELEAPVDPEQEAESYGDDPRANLQGTRPGWPIRFSDSSLTLEVPPEGRDDANFDLSRAP